MSTQNRPRRTAAGSSVEAPGISTIGKVRRAQLITTYGVGSMIAVEDASYIVAGLDDWKINQAQQVHEPRIQRALGVARLYLPPAADRRHAAALRRFPDFYSCQGCSLLQPYGRFGGRESTCACGGTLIPSRFVIACDDGHIDDFPYWAWAHRGSTATGPCKRELRMVTSGRTASLKSIEIVCGCGARASMEGAFRRSELLKLRITCSGARPWLGPGAKVDGCKRPPRTLQRGSSAAWFGAVRSSLAIPPWSTRLQKLIDPHFAMWAGEEDKTIARQAVKAGLIKEGEDPQAIIDAVRRREQLEDQEQPAAEVDLETELKAEEFAQLCAPAPADEETPDFECRPAAGNPPGTEFSQVMLVTRLREVRVLQTFSRVEPLTATDPLSRRGALSHGSLNWLPAMEVVGEGVFLRLSEQALKVWENDFRVRDRARRIRDNHQQLLDRRAETAGRQSTPSPVTARSVMIHTLAHALINEWSLDAGYSAAAMRERLYTGDDMAGILIYTATSDSAGSLGGIVRQGEPERLSRTVTAALRRAGWCSADPLCMEAGAAGADSLNLAACHVCSLLPETSCEHNNTLLDRGLLIGWPDHPNAGFFNSYLEANA
ncbi:hypothetical protein CS0771_32350 [Catellatospora sp. IY07-71]|uniref:DUF1998 domain-containing protein n=1 Tax=Catellatospora sp. IY07-71 TaxID=2728827 RepID=UPI001BB4545A|nr:DUF1998 domain-containing protein [Catellatospora sp. IY07-71]BCJ73691.1 hypothetical protein CS0771_32350 [Catellatospora sp. IY07-71]